MTTPFNTPFAACRRAGMPAHPLPVRGCWVLGLLLPLGDDLRHSAQREVRAYGGPA